MHRPFADLLDKVPHVNGLDGFPALAAGEGEVFVDHVLHLAQVALHGVVALGGLSEGEREFQTR